MRQMKAFKKTSKFADWEAGSTEMANDNNRDKNINCGHPDDLDITSNGSETVDGLSKPPAIQNSVNHGGMDQTTPKDKEGRRSRSRTRVLNMGRPAYCAMHNNGSSQCSSERKKFGRLSTTTNSVAHQNYDVNERSRSQPRSEAGLTKGDTHCHQRSGQPSKEFRRKLNMFESKKVGINSTNECAKANDIQTQRSQKQWEQSKEPTTMRNVLSVTESAIPLRLPTRTPYPRYNMSLPKKALSTEDVSNAKAHLKKPFTNLQRAKSTPKLPIWKPFANAQALKTEDKCKSLLKYHCVPCGVFATGM